MTNYLAGDLPAADYSRLTAALALERDAGVAQAQRYRAQAEEVLSEVRAVDVDAELRRALLELRSAIAGEIDSAEGVEALRAALTAAFEQVVLVHFPEFGTISLLPVVRESALDPVAWQGGPPWGEARPLRQPLHLQGNPGEAESETKDRLPHFVSAALFPPVEVVSGEAR